MTRPRKKGEPPGTQYKRVAERAAQGIYDLVYPLDMLMLDMLPDVGTTMGGYYELGTSVEAIGKALKEAKLTPDFISGRLRSMSYQGLTHKIKAVGDRRTANYQWQRTPLGKKLLDEWKEQQVGSQTTRGGEESTATETGSDNS